MKLRLESPLYSVEQSTAGACIWAKISFESEQHMRMDDIIQMIKKSALFELPDMGTVLIQDLQPQNIIST